MEVSRGGWGEGGRACGHNGLRSDAAGCFSFENKLFPVLEGLSIKLDLTESNLYVQLSKFQCNEYKCHISYSGGRDDE